MENQAKKETLLAAYVVPGFRAHTQVKSYEDKHPAFVIALKRRQKKRCAAVVAKRAVAFMTDVAGAPEILGVAGAKSIWTLRCAE